MNTQIKSQKFFDYLKFLDEFRAIKRATKVTGEDRYENDMEHIGQLALVCWYLIEAMDLNHDVGLVLKYVMAHDLMEVYAGDTDPYLSDKDYKDSKAEREEKAVEKMKDKFSELDDLHKMLQEYEDKATAEARFVYAVDKMLPVVNIFLSGEDYYTRNEITEERWREHNLPKMAKDESVLSIIEDMLAFMKQQKPDLFHQQK